ncbi:MAG TPA: VTT domain-containing protein [Candidatus Eisenbacteria bacterium]|nr:VTT domain-containing protein [Candidatus Eisenbacteria bacterium]
MNRARWITFALAVTAALVLGSFVARWAAPYITRENLEAWVKAAGAWGPFVILAVQAAQILVAPIPGVFVPILAGVLYGPLIGSLLTMIGTLLGANAAYWIGRSAGRAVAERWIGKQALEKAHALLQGKRWLALAAVFWIPFSPADSLCIVSGVVKMGWLPFTAAVLAGRLPKDVLIAAGSALGWNGFGLGGGP